MTNETRLQEAYYFIDGSSGNRAYLRIQWTGKHTKLVNLNAPKWKALHDNGHG